jgi:hypothetical protein
MIAGLMLLAAAAAGQVIEAGTEGALVRPAKAISVGDTLVVRRLEPLPGPPGRAPFFRWSHAAKVRVTAVRANGTAEVALLHGRVAVGDRVTAD